MTQKPRKQLYFDLFCYYKYVSLNNFRNYNFSYSYYTYAAYIDTLKIGYKECRLKVAAAYNRNLFLLFFFLSWYSSIL